VVALGVGWALRFLLGRRKPPIPVVGILIAVAMVGTLLRLQEQIDAELPALLAIFAGALLTRIRGIATWAQPLLVAPGAIWLAQVTPVTELTWVRVMIAVMIPLAGFLITDFEERHAGMGLGVVFFTIAVLGMFAAVPDTEWAVALLAVSVPVTFLAWPNVAASLGREGAYLAVAVFLLVTAQGGPARPPSIIGSAACLGLLLLEPLVIAVRPHAVRLTTWFNHNAAGAVLASVPQFIVMVLCSRVAARFTEYGPAILVVALVYSLTFALAVWAPGRIMAAEEPDDAPDPLYPGAPY
jgi:hypothetical protein